MSMGAKGDSATSTGTNPAGADVLRSGPDVPGATVPYNPANRADPSASVASSSGPGMDWQQFFEAQMNRASPTPNPIPAVDLGMMQAPVPGSGGVQNIGPLRFAPYSGAAQLSQAPGAGRFAPKQSNADMITQFLSMLGGAR